MLLKEGRCEVNAAFIRAKLNAPFRQFFGILDKLNLIGSLTVILKEHYVFCRPKAVAIYLIIFQMKLFIKFQIQVFTGPAMFCIKSVPNLTEWP